MKLIVAPAMVTYMYTWRLGWRAIRTDSCLMCGCAEADFLQRCTHPEPSVAKTR